MSTPTRSIKRPSRHNPNHETAPSPHAPPLPTTIQTSLLSVGMRIRKSVSEGYQNVALKGSKTHGSGSYRQQNLGAAPAPGLMPYCGIFRTGNLQPQEEKEECYRKLDCDEEVPALEWDLEGYPSSQESTDTISHHSPPIKAPNKRCYEDEDGDGISYPNPLGSHPLPQFKLSQPDALRPILQPKTRRCSRMLPVKETRDSCTIMDIDDFEDASFLKFEDCMERENEWV